MRNIEKIEFSGYKSYKDKNVIPKLKNINLIIGKNNSGKSSVIDILDFLADRQKLANVKNDVTITLSMLVTEEAIRKNFSENSYTGYYIYGNISDYEKAKPLIGGSLSFNYADAAEHVSINDNLNISESILREMPHLAYYLKETITKHAIKRISAERDVRPEEDSEKLELHSNGVGLTNMVAKYINDANRDEKLVQNDLLEALNFIMADDAQFDNIKVQQVTYNGKLCWEIFLTEKKSERFALSKMGSGLKTIILILVNLILVPELTKEPIIYAFEEIENNLHPALQRRVFEYLHWIAKEKDICITLTSHSHVAINCFYGKPTAQILHVEKKNNRSEIKTIETHLDKISILDDLDIRASDLFQSNGLIWVEGPSDRVYIKQWIELIDSEIKENVDYQFIYYGGKLLSHYSAEETEKLINILLINRNSLIVMDSDKKTAQAKINDTKKRIQEEFEKRKLICFITKGKEIENYLTCDAINDAFGTKLKQCSQYELFPDYIEKMYLETFSRKVDFSKIKVEFANKVHDKIKTTDLKNLDLQKNIKDIISTIRKWNHK